MNIVNKRYRVRAESPDQEWHVAEANSLEFAREIVADMRSAHRPDTEYRIWDTIDECWVDDSASLLLETEVSR